MKRKRAYPRFFAGHGISAPCISFLNILSSYFFFIIPLWTLLFLAGCAPRMWSHYPGGVSMTRWLLADGKDDLAVKQVDSILRSSKDRLLRSMELGMLHYLKGDFEMCIREWLTAEEIIDEFDRRPVISLRELSEQAGSFIINDYLITYQGMTYEKVLLHLYLALAYMMVSNSEEARVELKKAEQAQMDALEKLRARRNNFFRDSQDAAKIEDKLLNVYDTRFGISFNDNYDYVSNDLNPFVYYLSGWLYDSEGDIDDALIDYKRVWESGIHDDFLKEEIDRIARQMFSEKGIPREKIEDEGGDILILYHQDIIPNLEEFKVPIVLNDSVLMLAFPVYVESSLPKKKLYVKSGDKKVETREIVNIYSLAKESLRERAFGIAMRQAARLAFKATMSHQISKKGGNLASMFSSLYNILSERADLRSWLTIPQMIQAGRIRLSPGRHLLELYSEDNRMYNQIEVDISPGEYKILDIHLIGSRIIVHNS